jgi:hypothetical protein
MFIAIIHEIHDAAKFQKCAEDVFPLPEGLRVHHFFPATDLSQAVCLYEAPSVEGVQAYLDQALGDSSTQHYFPVAAEQGIGVPDRAIA